MKKILSLFGAILLGSTFISAAPSNQSNEQFHVNFKEHDLVAEYNTYVAPEAMERKVENGELILTSSTGKITYYSNIYEFTYGKTYFICGEYKASENVGLNFGLLPSWGEIKNGCSVTTEYQPFYYVFSPANGDNQFVIQTDVDKTIYLKNYYFGECRLAEKGVEIGELPTIPKKEGIDGKWKIDNEEITASTVFKWDEDKYADISYDLPTHVNFKEHNLVKEANIGGSSNIDVKVENNELVLTSSTESGEVYYSLQYTFDANKTYFVSGEYKTTAGAGANFVTLPDWTVVKACETSTSYAPFFATFTPKDNTDQFGIQCTYGGVGAVFNFRNLYFGECREVAKGSAIGELPTLESGKWQIDGTDITAETIFNWDENKYADIVKPTHVNFKEHDLVKEANIGGSSTMDVKVENNELILTSTSNTNNMYYSLEYTFDTNKTYFISGEYKTSDASGFHLWTLGSDPWGLIKTCETATSYTPFFATFTPADGTTQIGIQRAYPADTSTVTFTLKNFYFGECRSAEKGNPIGELPALEGGKWQIDGTDITAETIFNWDEDKYAEPVNVISDFKLAFTDKNIAKSTEGYDTNKKKITYSTDGTTLTLNGEESGAAVFLAPLDANIGHNYVISFDLKTEGNSQIVIGVDKKVESEIITTTYLQSTSIYTHYTFEFEAEFVEADPEIKVITAYIQFPDTYFGKAYLQNILIADLDDSKTIDVRYNNPVGELPAIPEGYDGKWFFCGKELTKDTVYNVEHSDVACLEATVKELTVSFKVNAEDTKIIATYKINYGQKLSEVITSLPEVPAVDGKTGKWVLDGKDLDLNTVVTSDITILASYTDVPTPGGGANIGLILGITIPCAAVAIGGGVTAFILIRKKKKTTTTISQ